MTSLLTVKRFEVRAGEPMKINDLEKSAHSVPRPSSPERRVETSNPSITPVWQHDEPLAIMAHCLRADSLSSFVTDDDGLEPFHDITWNPC